MAGPAQPRQGPVVVIGESVRVLPYALAGAVVVPCESPADVRSAWDRLPRDTALVVLTPAAAAAVRPTSESPLVAVLPGTEAPR
jgi:hypothetical protein